MKKLPLFIIGVMVCVCAPYVGSPIYSTIDEKFIAQKPYSAKEGSTRTTRQLRFKKLRIFKDGITMTDILNVLTEEEKERVQKADNYDTFVNAMFPYAINIDLYYADGNDAAATTVNRTLAEACFGKYGIYLPLKEAANSYVIDDIRDYIMTDFSWNDDYTSEEIMWPACHNYRNFIAETRDGKNGITIYKLVNYGGGIYNYYMVDAFNFDGNTGKVLTHDDVFLPGYEEKLANEIFAAIDRKEGKGASKSRYGNWKYPYDSRDIGEFIPKNFLLEEDSITFIFSESSIGPRCDGCLEYRVAYSDVSDLLR